MRRPSLSYTVWILAGLLTPPVATLAEEKPLVLIFGVYTSDKPTEMYGKFKPVLAHLEARLQADLDQKVRIKLKIHKTYEAAITAFVKGEVDFVRFGPASYILAKKGNPGIELLAIELKGEKRIRRFKGVIFCRDDSSIQTIRDLKGKKFAFGDEHSTIGRYLSQAVLVEAGIREKDLEYFKYLGRHDLVVAAVLYRHYDAGAAKISTYDEKKYRGLKTLATFENVTKPWVARAGLHESIRKRLKKALLSIKDRKLLSSIGKKLTGFGEVKDSEYEEVRAGMQESEEFSNERTCSSSASR